MQDIHGILGGGASTGGGGGGGRIFGDRRLRAAAHGHHHQQALKCPRCDSLNTKFCYYNNYNLSQPRHFCKNCRRYWTKGGVLRNVPVGGGCRKSKRSSKRKTSSSPPPPSSASKEQHKSNSRSSSESTSANTTNTAATRALSASCYADVSDAAGSGKGMGLATIVSEAGSEYSSSAPLFKFSEKPPATATVSFDNIVPPPHPPCDVMNVNFEQLTDHQGAGGIATVGSGAGGMFTEIGSFVGLMAGDQHQNLLGFGAGGDMGPAPTPFRMHQQNQVNHDHHHHHDNQLMVQNLTADDWQMGKMEGGGDHWGPGILGQTVHVGLLPSNRTGDGVLAGADWHGVSGDGDAGVGGGGGHLGLYDLTHGSGVVHHGHWNQTGQWHESDDHHIYLPP